MAETKLAESDLVYSNGAMDTKTAEDRETRNEKLSSKNPSLVDSNPYDFLPVQVQNSEVTSSKDPNVIRNVNNVPLVASVMISDSESDEENPETDIPNKVAYNTIGVNYGPTETDSKTDIEYTLVCVHIETFKVSNESSISLTQIGCSTALNVKREKENFFKPIKPARLKHFVDNFKMEGDLLKALHMTDENGKFEFRAQFEIKRKEKNKVYCTSEEEALAAFTKYLEKFQNVILFAVDEDTMQVILGKLAQFRSDKDLPVRGFTTWPKVLDHCLKFAGKQIYEKGSDLEDFYSRHCGKVSGYITALDVANFLRKSIKKLCSDYAFRFGKVKPEEKFSKNAFILEVIEDIRNIENRIAEKVEDNKPLSVEVFSSFRPAVSTTIGIEHMDTIELSSGEESEDSNIDIIEENLKPKTITKKRNIDDLELKSKKRKYPHDFPEYPLPKKPNFCEDSILLSSDSEDGDDEITLEMHNPFPVPRGLDSIKERLGSNSQLSITRINEGVWLGKANPVQNPKCLICELEFRYTEQLETHTEREHMYCKVCNLFFDVLQEAVIHKKVHELDVLQEAVIHKKVHELSESMNEIVKTATNADDGVSDYEFSDEEKLDKDLDDICQAYKLPIPDVEKNANDEEFLSSTPLQYPGLVVRKGFVNC
eukprot:GFUD01036909.1.p1 GENE.GFUD01036909.1~~GFUD01036909.1.p1  ORF type:complete len:662 (+),score=191.14 GFUD01036909.1:28-1986(+)